MKFPGAAWTAVALVIVASLPAFAQAPRARRWGVPLHASAEPPFAALGERMTYRGWVMVESDDLLRWATPETGGAFTWGTPRGGRVPFTVARRGGPPTGDSVWVEIPVQVFAVGRVTIPGLEFRLDDHAGPVRTGHLPVVRIGIQPTAANDSSAGLLPARGPLAAPWWERVPWRWVASALGLVAVAFLLWRRLRRRAPRPAPAAAPVTARRRDPAAEALADLAALKRMLLLEQGRFDEHAWRLSRILRRYLESTLGVLRPGDSTPELLERLELGRLSPEELERLAALLRRWDGIQFARFPSDVAEGQRCEETVRELVLRAARPATPRPEVA